jgi:hypothetical protein
LIVLAKDLAKNLAFLPPESDFLVTEFPTPRPELADRVAVVVIANAGALIHEQPAACLPPG